MKKLILLFLSLTSLAQAQDLNYYLTPQSQIDSMQASNYYANAAANAWLSYCQQMRAQGYTGPINCPWANTQTLMNSNRELQGVYAAQNQGWYANQAAQGNAMNNWGEMMRDSAQVQGYWVQPSAANYQWVNPNTGVVVPTSGYWPPNYQQPWNLLQR